MTEQRKRGFALRTPEERKEIARLGGQSVKAENRPFAKDKGLAARAGSKGGTISRKPKKPNEGNQNV